MHYVAMPVMVAGESLSLQWLAAENKLHLNLLSDLLNASWKGISKVTKY